MALLTSVLPSLLLLLIAGSTTASSSNVHVIRDAGDLIKLSNDILDGVNFTGTTVYLDSDIVFDDELSSHYVPIGRYVDYKFNGVFDGQGHRIIGLKELTQDPEGSYAGLFGYSLGSTTIRNVVMDSSCTITSNYSARYSGAYAGGIIGGCGTDKGPCLVENCVNMADITFIGGLDLSEGNTPYLFMGGIVAELYSTEHDIVIRNCVNYGTISRTGTYTMLTYIGGIAGDSLRGNGKIYVQNCMNYGTLSHDEPEGWFYIGGIAGRYRETYLENCVSAGTIITSSDNGQKGALIPGSFSSTFVKHCFWTSDTGCVNASGSGGSPDANSSLVAINSTTVNELNEYAANNNWTKWLLNTNNASVSFKVDNGAKDTTFSSQLILLPDLAGDGNETRFSGWHKDTEFLNPLSEYEVSGDTEFYSTYGALYKVVFDGNGGDATASSKVVKTSNPYGSLPSANRTGHTFVGWFTGITDGEQITPETVANVIEDRTLYAHWTTNNYTLTFDYNNGTEPLVLEVPYGSPIEYPVDLYRRGASFTRWDKDLRAMPAHNLTVTAEWVLFVYTATFDFGNGTMETVPLRYGEAIPYPDVPEQDGYIFEWTPRPKTMPDSRVDITGKWVKVSNYVKITFATKDLSEEEANAIVVGYSSSNYTIENFVVDGEESILIIKFVDETSAKNFVEKVEASSNKGIISKVEYTDEIKSLSAPMSHPIFLPLLFIF